MKTDGSGEQSVATELRQLLSQVVTESELALDGAFGDVTREQEESLGRVIRAAIEVDGIIALDDGLTFGSEETLSDSNTVDTVDSIAILTNDALPDTFVRTSEFPAVDVESIETPIALVEHHDVTEFDLLLVDSVWSDGSGLDVLEALPIPPAELPPVGFVSLEVVEDLPHLGVSGLLNPGIPEAALQDTFTALDGVTGQDGSDSSVSVAGYVKSLPETALGDRLTAHPETTVFADSVDLSPLYDVEWHADVVCCDLAVYRDLSPANRVRLRAGNGSQYRPLVLLTDTASDPSDRDWIPTIGGGRFVARPPTMADLLSQALASGAEVANE